MGKRCRASLRICTTQTTLTSSHCEQNSPGQNPPKPRCSPVFWIKEHLGGVEAEGQRFQTKTMIPTFRVTTAPGGSPSITPQAAHLSAARPW